MASHNRKSQSSKASSFSLVDDHVTSYWYLRQLESRRPKDDGDYVLLRASRIQVRLVVTDEALQFMVALKFTTTPHVTPSPPNKTRSQCREEPKYHKESFNHLNLTIASNTPFLSQTSRSKSCCPVMMRESTKNKHNQAALNSETPRHPAISLQPSPPGRPRHEPHCCPADHPQIVQRSTSSSV